MQLFRPTGPAAAPRSSRRAPTSPLRPDRPLPPSGPALAGLQGQGGRKEGPPVFGRQAFAPSPSSSLSGQIANPRPTDEMDVDEPSLPSHPSPPYFAPPSLLDHQDDDDDPMPLAPSSSSDEAGEDHTQWAGFQKAPRAFGGAKELGLERLIEEWSIDDVRSASESGEREQGKGRWGGWLGRWES